MSEPETKDGSGAWTGLAAVGAVALVIGCCATVPLVAAFAGSIAVGAVLGIGAGAVALIVMVGLVVLRVRRRAACETPEPESRAGPRS